MKNETYECPNSLPATVDSCFALFGARQHSVADSEFLHQKVYTFKYILIYIKVTIHNDVHSFSVINSSVGT